MRKILIDIRDLDGEWFRGVEAYLDDVQDRYCFTREQAGRMGEVDSDGCYLDCTDVEARADWFDLDGVWTLLYCVPCRSITTRPSKES